MAQTPLNPFQAPQADLERRQTTGGSLEDAIEGRYDFTIGEVMSEAWELTKGFKGPFWGAVLLLYVGIILFVALIVGVTTGASGEPMSLGVSLLVNIGTYALLAPVLMGLTMMSVRRAQGQPVTFSTVFAHFDKTPAAIGGMLLTALLTYLGLFLLVIPGIYLALAYAMTMPLIADRNLSVWRAMETSRKALTHKWFRLLGLYLVVGLLAMVSCIPLLIPLIWTMPWSMLVTGVIYKRIFGLPQEQPPTAA